MDEDQPSTRRPLVVLPTYNEAGNIVSMLESLRALPLEVDVLVVDDGSPDGTADLADSVAARVGGIRVLRRHGKSGLGDAYRAGMAWAVEHGHHVIVQMDCDFSHDPSALPGLLAVSEQGADLVIGSRYVTGGSIPDWPWHRRLLSAFANRYATFLLGLPFRDVTSGYRVWSTSTLTRIRFDTTRSSGYLFLPELTFRAKLAGARIVEAPISFKDRTAGTSKMSLRVILESMARISIWGVRTRLRFRRVRLGGVTDADRPPAQRTGTAS